MKIIYTPQAREDLREIKEYISSVLENPGAGKNITVSTSNCEGEIKGGDSINILDYIDIIIFIY